MAAKQNKVLVVEDDVTMRQIVVRKLTMSDFDVVEAADGKEAVDVWKKEKPDIVLLDLMLPEMDGFKVLETMRSHNDPATSKTSVIVLSNLYSKEDIQRAKNLSIDDFMVKAYHTTEEILEKVRDTLKKDKKI